MSIVTWERSRPLLSPLHTTRPWLASLVAVVVASAFIAVSAQAYAELRIGPVPISGQTFAVLLVGATLGSRLGAAAVLLYLAEGIAGLPVFSGGNAGWAYFSGGATGGYLAGFVVGAFIVGWLAEHGWDRHVVTMALAMTIAHVAVYAIGVIRLSDFVGWDRVWALGVQPFLGGDAAKIAIASGLLPGAWKIRRFLFGDASVSRM
ncbi:MAG: biotin transporter BioY [Chloroflexi bacterium]|nr:biotin transporter BioY [Chloroflexota bacterium]